MNFLDPRLPDRFWSKCIPEPMSGCWLWLGAKNRYGRFVVDGKARATHRLTYEALRGSVPPGLELDHCVCQTPLCCNPLHLEAVTHRENVRRGRMSEVNSARQRNKTHCPKGHPYDAENTYRNKKTNCRGCRTCGRAGSARINREKRHSRGLVRKRKLREQDVLVIRRRIAAGERAWLISLDLNVSQQTIYDINAGRSWAWLKSE